MVATVGGTLPAVIIYGVVNASPDSLSLDSIATTPDEAEAIAPPSGSPQVWE